MSGVALVNQCRHIIDRAYAECPDTFATTAKSVQEFLSTLPEKERYYDQIAPLRDRIERYQFKIAFNALKQAHAAGKDISDDLMGFVTIGHPNNPQCLKNDEARDLYNLGKKTGVFGNGSDPTRELFVENVKTLWLIDLDHSPFLSFIQGVVQSVFSSSPSKPTYGYSLETCKRTQAANHPVNQNHYHQPSPNITSFQYALNQGAFQPHIFYPK